MGDPYKDGCKQPVECNVDQDCPKAAKCDTSNGIHKCKDVCQNTQCGPNADCIPVDHEGHCSCRNGYQGNPKDFSVGCTPKPVTCRVTSDCPANTYCYDRFCRRKYINNKIVINIITKIVCVITAPCQTDSECSLDEKCLKGQCLGPCEVKDACGMNAKCTAINHDKLCSCPEGFTGSPDVECFRGRSKKNFINTKKNN